MTRVANGYKLLERRQESEIYFRKALKIRSRDRYALLGLADLYHKTDQVDAAIEYYEKVLETGAELINVLTMVGNLCWQRHDLEKAKGYFERALRIEPANPYALYGLGNCHRYEGDYQGAIELWERILQTDTGTVNMLSRLGDAYRNVGNLEAAEEIYDAILDKGYDKYTLLGLAKLRCAQGRIADTYDIFHQMLIQEREDPRFISDLGQLLTEHDSPDKFAAFYRRVLKDEQVPEETRERLRNFAEPPADRNDADSSGSPS